MEIKDPIMDMLQADPAGGLATWVLILAFIALVVALCILLLLQKNSDKARYILGIVVGIIGLYNVTFPVINLVGGIALSQYIIANVLVGIALLFLSAGSIWHEYTLPCALVFLVLIGPGIFLMIGSWVGSGFPSVYLVIISLIWAVIWVSLMALLSYGYLKKSKTDKIA